MKSYLYASAGVIAVVGVVLSPVLASAATDTTDVNVTVDSAITVTTSGTVAIAINTPVGGGSQSSASDTVTVNSNDPDGFDLTLADSDATTNLVNGANTVAAHSGTYATPTALANNTWGWAVASLGTFDASYSVIDDATSSASKWAGVPATGSPQNIKSTSSTASNDVTTVWYSAKVDTTKPAGVYTDTVTYTATVK